MTCARCSAPLTARQVGRGTRYCSRRCHAQLRRQSPPSTRTTCRACPRRLTPVQVARRHEHCSIRCAMRTRYGRPAPTSRRCEECSGPLTRRQQWRRRRFCSRGCAKRAEWRRRPEVQALAIQRSHAVQRKAFVARLRRFLLTHTVAEAGARGWHNGLSAATRHARLRKWTPPRQPRGAGLAAQAAIVAAAPSAAEAYRRCYAAAWARVWPARATAA